MVIFIREEKEEVLNEDVHKSPVLWGGGRYPALQSGFRYWAEEWYKSETVHYFCTFVLPPSPPSEVHNVMIGLPSARL